MEGVRDCNATTDAQLQQCYSHGVCLFNNATNAHQCICKDHYELKLNCFMTKDEYFAGGNVALYLVRKIRKSMFPTLTFRRSLCPPLWNRNILRRVLMPHT